MKLPKIFSNDEWKQLKKIQDLPQSERTIVFYAENLASINHFREIISELTEKRNLHVCYVTSVKDDPLLFSQNAKIKSFYIGDGTARTNFFLTLNAKILLMDMPDLNNFHIKRSKVYPVHYIYIFHSIFSVHSYLRKSAIDNYDTIFCVGKHHVNEIQATEKIYDLKPKKLIEYGFGRIDTLLKNKILEKTSNTSNCIIIAPSYGKNNLLEVCGISLINLLLKENFKVLLRPHFKTLKDSKKLITTILHKFEDNPNFSFEKGIISNEKLNDSLCMISDWSGISFEYSLVFERQVIFIDVPKKTQNPNFNDISLEPIEISFRKKLGSVISPENIDQIPEIIKNKKEIDQNKKTKSLGSELVFNIGESAKIGANFIQEIIVSKNY